MCLLALALPAMAQTDSPQLRVSAKPGAILVEASDQEGLATVEIASADTTWHTSLSGAAPMRTLTRSFTVRELFPDLEPTLDSLELKVTVRNTRGQSASSTVLVRLKSNGK